MHDPVGLETLGRSPFVEHQSLLHADVHVARARVDRLVSAGGLPVPRRSRSVRPHAVRVLPISRAKEIPFSIPKLRHGYTQTIRETKKKKKSIQNQSLNIEKS